MKRWEAIAEVIESEFSGQDILKFVEVGTAAGRNIEGLLDTLDEDYPIEIWCVDPYERYPGYENCPCAQRKALQKNKNKAINTMFKLDNVKWLQMMSDEAASYFVDEALDMVYIDGNHSYEYVKEDLLLWWPKVREGGILSGHDYVNRDRFGVVDAVDEFLEENNLEMLDKFGQNSWFVGKDGNNT